jgi:hypothetical protein
VIGGGMNRSLIKLFHKNPAYVPCSKPKQKPLKLSDEKTLTNRIEMILTNV